MPDMLDHLLAPLCRLLVARGVLFADLAERLKGHYVQAAQALSEGKTTDSRLSVMTGLQRREIARLKGIKAKPGKPNPLSKLVALWQSDSAYMDGAKPLSLPRTGPAPSFESLAFEIRKDVHPRTMLDTLETAGTVRIDEDDRVHLVETAYLPLSGSEDQLAYLAFNVGDHLAAASDNVLGHTPPYFERAVHYGGLSEAQLARLSDRFHEGQMALLEALNREAAAMKTSGEESGIMRFRAGGYFYSTDEGEA